MTRNYLLFVEDILEAIESQGWRIRPRILENDMSWERKRGVAENRDIFRED